MIVNIDKLLFRFVIKRSFLTNQINFLLKNASRHASDQLYWENKAGAQRFKPIYRLSASYSGVRGGLLRTPNGSDGMFSYLFNCAWSGLMLLCRLFQV